MAPRPTEPWYGASSDLPVRRPPRARTPGLEWPITGALVYRWAKRWAGQTTDRLEVEWRQRAISASLRNGGDTNGQAEFLAERIRHHLRPILAELERLHVVEQRHDDLAQAARVLVLRLVRGEDVDGDSGPVDDLVRLLGLVERGEAPPVGERGVSWTWADVRAGRGPTVKAEQ